MKDHVPMMPKAEIIGPSANEPGHAMSLIAAAALCAIGLALVGCGTSPGCRALTGGALGAAGGAALGAIGGNPGLGALAGGATGAVAGGLTSPNQVYAGQSSVCE